MSRIAKKFQELKREGRAALIPYITAGFPPDADPLRVLEGLEASGADLIEMGIPFSDPIADGPIIQQTSQIALEAGMDISGALKIVERFRTGSLLPVVLFSYYNPILQYGVAQFAEDAAGAGVDGVLVTDLPYEEAGELRATLKSHGLDLISLIAPTTSPSRLRMIVAEATGFLYYISRLGVTGPREELATELRDKVAEIHRVTPLPVAVGFGISDPEQAAHVAEFAEGVVVGSAFLERILEADLNGGLQFLKEIRHVLSGRVSSLSISPSS